MQVRRFIVRRLLLGPPVLFGIAFFVFMLVRIGGQNPAAMLAGPNYSPESYAAILRDLGLDRPLLEQFAIWLGNVVQGDLGTSWLSNSAVLNELLVRLPITLELLVLSVALGALVGIPLGLVAAFRENRPVDHVIRMVSLLGFSVPTYWLSLVSIFLFFYLLEWAPPPMGRIGLMVPKPPEVLGTYFTDALIAGDGRAARSALSQMAMPLVIMAIVAGAPIVKQMRAVALEVLGSDFVRFARAQGLSQAALWRIAFKHSLVPVVVFIGSEIVGLLGLVSIVEFIFSWGGMGQLGINAIIAGDFAVVQGYVLVLALISFLMFVAIDVWALIHDPRGALAR